MKHSAVYGIFAAIVVSASDCGNRVDHSTPQSVAESFKNAASKEDWSTAFKCLTDDSQEIMLLPVLLLGSLSGYGDKEKDKEIKAILDRHGVDLKDKQGRLKRVKDKGALFGDYIAWAKKHAGDVDKSSGFSKITDEKIENIQIDGDTATAGRGKQKMHFKKIDGKWYIDLLGTIAGRLEP